MEKVAGSSPVESTIRRRFRNPKAMARCLAVALAKADRRLYTSVHYVYILRSIAEPDRFYVGSTADLKKRLADHNAGASPHTAKFRPWDLIWYCSFKTKA